MLSGNISRTKTRLPRFHATPYWPSPVTMPRTQTIPPSNVNAQWSTFSRSSHVRSERRAFWETSSALSAHDPSDP